MQHNPYDAPTAALGASRPRVRESGNESYHKLARAHFALGCFGAFLTLVSISLFFGPQGLPWLAAATLAMFAGITVLHFMVWHGARQRRQWARIISLVMAVMMLFAFPLGTVMGIYLIFKAAAPWPEPHVYTFSIDDVFPSQAPPPIPPPLPAREPA